jgi:MFS family permease
MFQVLRHRGFRDLYIGQSISQVGDALYYMVFMFMVGKVTGDPAMVGAVGAVEMLPFVLFSGYAGVLADRIDRRLILLWTDWICMGILLALSALIFVTGTPPVEALFVSAFLLGVFRAAFYPAKNAAIPNLVPLDETLAANTLNAMTFNVVFTLGLTLSGGVLSILYGLSSTWFFGITVLLNAASFGLSAVYIRRLPQLLAERGDEVRHPWAEFKDGFSYITQRRALSVLMVAGLFMSLAISPFIVTYVAANDLWFGGKPQTLTFFEASFFVGMIIGSIVLSRIKWTKVGLGYAMGLGITGVMVALMAFSPVAWAFAFWNFVCGLFIPFADIPVQTYVQVKVEDAFRGRVNSALTMLRNGMTPLGMGLGGWAISRIGLVNMFLLMGIGMAVVAGAALCDRAFRRASLSEEDAPPEPPMDEEVRPCEAAA